jgi:hypothetical protein
MAIKQNVAVIVGLGIVIVAVVLALMKPVPAGSLNATRFGDGSSSGSAASIVVQKNAPIVLRFLGDLAIAGHRENDGTTFPYVIADEIKLEAEVVNGVEYRWTVNNQPILDSNKKEWSSKLERTFLFEKSGSHIFALQVRGAKDDLLSQPKEVKLDIETLRIQSFEPSLVEDDDRVLVGEEFTVEVEMVDPLTADLDFYEYRYSVNDVPIKHPDTDEEWSTENSLTYPFEKPGRYNMKVEVRRAGQTEVEASMALADTVIVGSALLLSFDTSPEKYSQLGKPVKLDAFPESVSGKDECRFGFKKVIDSEFEWIKEDNGAEWGYGERKWTPREAGNYLLRVEIRETGRTQVDDYRELLFTVTEGDF